MSTRDPHDLVASPSQTVGPFFHFCLTTNAALGEMAGPDTPGERLRLRVRVFDGAGVPVPDAMVELWQVDANGVAVTAPGPTFLGWGRLPTDDEGACEFGTIRPGRVTGPDGVTQAAHINVCLFMRGLLRHIFTRIYFADDPALAADPVLNTVPADRRATLQAASDADGRWTFDIHLRGDRETVFFDL